MKNSERTGEQEVVLRGKVEYKTCGIYFRDQDSGTEYRLEEVREGNKVYLWCDQLELWVS